MTYAYSTDQTTIDERYDELPAQHWVADSETEGHYEPLDADNAASFGYYVYDDTAPRPPDTETTTWDRTEPFVGDQFVVTWTERPWTADELAAQDADANTTQMVAESDESVDKLVLVVEALNALTDMTNADINANPAAIIKDLARECKTIARQANREARLTSGRTESTDTGTEQGDA